MGILLDIVLISIIMLNIIIGYKKGLIKVILNVFAFVISIIVTLILFKPISAIVINNTEIDENIKQLIIEKENIELEKNKESNVEAENNKNALSKYIENKINEKKGETIEKIAYIISIRITEILVGFGLFVALRIILIILKLFGDGISKIPIIKQFNEIGGVIYGILKSILIIGFIITILYLIISIKNDGIIASILNESYLTKFLYRINPIVYFFLK